MTAFPTIQATARGYEVSSFASDQMAQANGAVHYKQGGVISNCPINITFSPVKLSVAEAVSTHYETSQQHEPFQISTNLWQTHSSLYDLVPSNQSYRYTAPPARKSLGGGFFSVTIQIQSFISSL